MTDDRPPVAAPALTEQDRATYRLLIRIKPDGPADAAPFEGYSVEVGIDVVARGIDQPGDTRLHEVKIHRSRHQAQGRNDSQRGQGEYDTDRYA